MKRIVLAGILILLCAFAQAQSVTDPMKKTDSLNVAGTAHADSAKVASAPKADSAKVALDLIIFRNADEMPYPAWPCSGGCCNRSLKQVR